MDLSKCVKCEFIIIQSILTTQSDDDRHKSKLTWWITIKCFITNLKSMINTKKNSLRILVTELCLSSKWCIEFDIMQFTQQNHSNKRTVTCVKTILQFQCYLSRTCSFDCCGHQWRNTTDTNTQLWRFNVQVLIFHLLNKTWEKQAY